MNKTFTFLFAAVLTASCGDKSAEEKRDSTNDTVSSAVNNTETQPEVASVAPKVFYYDYTEKRTSGDEPVAMGKDEAIETFKTLPATDGNFFGLDLGDKGVVQFMYDEKKTLLLDIPDPVSMKSFGKEITLDEALKIISDVYDGKGPDDVKEMMK